MPVEPEVMVGGTPYLCEMLFDHNGGGHSEGFHFWVDDAVAGPATALLEVMKGLAKERRKVLSENSKILAIRVSREDRQGDSARRTGEDWNCGDGKVGGASAPWDQGAQLVVTDQSLQVRSIKPMGGFAIADLNLTAAASPIRNVSSTKLTTYANYLRNVLTTNQGPENGGTIHGCIAAMRKGDDVDPKFRVSKWEQDFAGFLKLTLLDGAPEWESGDLVHLHHTRKKGVTGVCGYYRVVSTEVVAGKTVVTLNGQTCYPMQVFENLITTLQLRPTVYYQCNDLQVGNYCERPVGRPFFLRPGRRPNRSC